MLRSKKVVIFMWVLLVCSLIANVLIIVFNPSNYIVYGLCWLAFWSVYSYLTSESTLTQVEKRRFRVIVLSYVSPMIVVLLLCLINTWAEWLPISYSSRTTGILAMPLFLFEAVFLIRATRQQE